MNDAAEVSGDDKRVQVSDKMRAERRKTPKGQSLRACSGVREFITT